MELDMDDSLMAERNMTYEDYLNFIYADINSTSSTLPPLDELISVTIVYGLTFLLGVLGNILVIVAVARYRRLQTVTNTFLISLASADLLLVSLCVPVKLIKWFTFTWTLGEPMCRLVHYLQNVSVICSILTLTAISLERYYAILHPMKAKYMCTMKRAKRLICLLWAVSLLLATPILVSMALEEVGTFRKGYWCRKQWTIDWHAPLYEVSMLTILFIVPLILMTFAYVSICRELVLVSRRRSSLHAHRKDLKDGMSNTKFLSIRCARKSRTETRVGAQAGSQYARYSTTTLRTTRDDNKTRKQVIKMLLAIIFLFVLCWGPILINNVLIAFGAIPDVHYGSLKPMRQAFSIMAYLNSCANPIVYAFMSKNFRTSFQATLRCLVCCISRTRKTHKHNGNNVSMLARSSHWSRQMSSSSTSGVRKGPKNSDALIRMGSRSNDFYTQIDCLTENDEFDTSLNTGKSEN